MIYRQYIPMIILHLLFGGITVYDLLCYEFLRFSVLTLIISSSNIPGWGRLAGTLYRPQVFSRIPDVSPGEKNGSDIYRILVGLAKAQGRKLLSVRDRIGTHLPTGG